MSYFQTLYDNRHELIKHIRCAIVCLSIVRLFKDQGLIQCACFTISLFTIIRPHDANQLQFYIILFLKIIRKIDLLLDDPGISS